MKLLILLQWGKVIPYWVEAVDVLGARGVDVSVGGLQSSGPLQEIFRAKGVEAFGLDADRAYLYPRATARLSRIVRRSQPDLVLGVGSIPTTVAGLAVRRARTGKCIALRNYVERAETTPFPQLATRVSHYTMAVSRAAAGAAEKDGVPRERICIALNGAAAPRAGPEEEILRLKDDLGIPRDAAVAAVIARLRPDRGHIVLLRAVTRLPEETRRRLHLVFVGEGTERRNLETAAGELGMTQQVHLVGDQVDVGPWFTMADVVVTPSLQESFGKSAAEAMSVGKPVVASTTGGLVEFVVDGESGVLFESGNDVELAQKLQMVLTDESLADALRRNAVKHYEDGLTIASMVDRWLRCFARFGFAS